MPCVRPGSADMRRSQRGFTLIEVLVALAVFGVVALTLLAQSRELTHQAAGIEDRLLAHWVADNTLTDLQTSPVFPDLGVTDTTAVMAGRDWYVGIRVSPTPSLRVRNIEVTVSPYNPLQDKHGTALVRETGFVLQRTPGVSR